MTTEVDNGRRAEVAHIFNSAVAATALGAAWDSGALAELREHGALEVSDFAARRDFDPTATMAMFAALASVGIVERDGDKIRTGALFAEAERSKPLFYWLCQGSWELFAHMSAMLPTANRVGEFHHRDARAISFASREANTRFFSPVFWRAMENVGEFSVVADLGCGSGEKLIEIVERYPGTRGLGLDIAQGAVDMATEEVARKGLSERISIVTCDVRDMAPRPEFAEVELLTSFMMGHDLWPRHNCVATLRRLRELFPHVRRFLLGDTVRTTGIPDHDVPIFSLGFEVGHDLMGTYLPTLADWRDVFAEGGWDCVGTHVSEALAGTVVFELVNP